MQGYRHSTTIPSPISNSEYVMNADFVSTEFLYTERKWRSGPSLLTRTQIHCQDAFHPALGLAHRPRTCQRRAKPASRNPSSASCRSSAHCNAARIGQLLCQYRRKVRIACSLLRPKVRKDGLSQAGVIGGPSASATLKAARRHRAQSRPPAQPRLGQECTRVPRCPRLLRQVEDPRDS
jgi:hypothetical protein